MWAWVDHWVHPFGLTKWGNVLCLNDQFCVVIIVPITTNCFQKRIWQQVDMDQLCRTRISVRGLNPIRQMIKTRKTGGVRSESEIWTDFVLSQSKLNQPPSGRMSVSSEKPTCMMACLGFPFSLLRKVTTQYGTPNAFIAEAQTMQCPAQFA